MNFCGAVWAALFLGVAWTAVSTAFTSSFAGLQLPGVAVRNVNASQYISAAPQSAVDYFSLMAGLAVNAFQAIAALAWNALTVWWQLGQLIAGSLSAAGLTGLAQFAVAVGMAATVAVNSMVALCIIQYVLSRGSLY